MQGLLKEPTRSVTMLASRFEGIMSRFPDLSNEYVLVIDDRVKDPKTNFLTSLRQQIKRKAGALPYIGGSAR